MTESIQKKKSRSWLLILLEILCIAAVCGLVYYFAHKHLPGLVEVLKSGNEKDIEAYLRQTGADSSLLILLFMQIIQVVSIVIPGTPIQIAAGVALGLRNGFLVSYLGFILANYLVFKIARIFNKTIREFLQKHLKKDGKVARSYEHLLTSDQNLSVLIISYIVPFLPNGIIPYAASQMKLTDLQFLLATALGSFIPIFGDCCVGNFILRGDYLAAILIFAILYAIAGLFLLSKKEITQHFTHKKASSSKGE